MDLSGGAGGHNFDGKKKETPKEESFFDKILSAFGCINRDEKKL